MTVRIGDNIIALQSEEGFWSGALEKTVTPPLIFSAEMAVWLDDIYQAVGHEQQYSRRHGRPVTKLQGLQISAVLLSVPTPSLSSVLPPTKSTLPSCMDVAVFS